jgi:hypothetical protein
MATVFINQFLFKIFDIIFDLKKARKIIFPNLFTISIFFKQWSPLRQEPEAPQNNATSRGLHRIPPPAEAGGFQTAGLNVLLIPFICRFF